jgi:hypothetical protein
LTGTRGEVEVDLAPQRSNRVKRRLTFTFRGARCAKRAHCVRLSGVLHGTLIANRHQIPDVGESFAVHASGRLQPIGRVSVTGSVGGTGNILRGYESLRLSVRADHGSIVIGARSGQVPGDSAP